MSTENGRRPSDGISLLIVDEHPVVRAGVRSLLDNQDGVEVVAEADNVNDAVDIIRTSAPDVVLMDVHESSPDTVADMRRLRREVPDGALVVLAGRDDDEAVYRAVVGGAAGHVSNAAQPAELVDTIRRAADGDQPIRDTLVQRPALGRRVLEAFARLAAHGPARPDPQLSEREADILSYAARGMTNQQIGRQIGLSEHTVKAAISRLLARLGLRHRTEAVVHAIRRGWIQPPAVVAQPVDGEPTFGEPYDE